MAAHVTVSIQIAAPRNHVFGFLKDANSHMKWSGGLQHISQQGLLEPGMTYQTTHVMLGREIKSINTVRSIITNQILEIQNINGPLEYRISYSLAPHGTGTTVSCSINIDSRHAAFRLAAPLFEMLVEAQIQRDLLQLKEISEAAPLKPA